MPHGILSPFCKTAGIVELIPQSQLAPSPRHPYSLESFSGYDLHAMIFRKRNFLWLRLYPFPFQPLCLLASSTDITLQHLCISVAICATHWGLGLSAQTTEAQSCCVSWPEESQLLYLNVSRYAVYAVLQLCALEELASERGRSAWALFLPAHSIHYTIDILHVSCQYMWLSWEDRLCHL